MGDEVQAIKAGLLEVADIVVVNKADRPGAERTAAQLKAMLVAAPVAVAGHGAAAHRPRPKRPEVLLATATTGPGRGRAARRSRRAAAERRGQPGTVRRADVPEPRPRCGRSLATASAHDSCPRPTARACAGSWTTSPTTGSTRSRPPMRSVGRLNGTE